MSSQFTIALNGLRFFAEHGMYPEERKVGNDFEVDISLVTRAPKQKITSIEQTINYVEVYRILNEAFAERTLLLESLAMEIAERIYLQFPEIKKITICIRKQHPPITQFSGSVSVLYSKTFK